ncbi:CST complex subunit STN1 [Spea bombifrons]|uniref:CST complex subunit STN1 n=1 Tax=Spea bombifrons TaxID=233779 RepID=UPI00234B26A3|nr:CST complex subunit STN1 [Spea bombifrons]
MEEIPSLLWGLDPVFLAFAKLYIKDILELRESHQVPGIFFYKGHPIKQVDILGTVVCVREKENFYSYGVDDSTGVISCTCWKNTMNNASSSAVPSHQSASEPKGLDDLMQELYREESKQAKMEIGDVIRVRGYIKVFRNQREIVASSFCKVDDPMLNMQIARMFDVLYLYRNVYDKVFEIPKHLKDPSGEKTDQDVISTSSLISLLSEKIKVFLAENKIQNFYQRELEGVACLLAVARSSCTDAKADTKMNSSAKEIDNLFKGAIRLLLEQGIVFQKGQHRDVYQVTDHDKELYKLTLNVIQEDCKRQKHAEKGCHFLHVLNCVRQSLGPNVREVVLQRVIGALENNSDIVSTMENYYTAF